MSGAAPLPLAASLRDALAVARTVRSRDDLAHALERLSADVAAVLGMRTVAISLHRPAWDDFETVAVHGDPAVRQARHGMTTSWAQWAPYLEPRFERRGAHHVPAGSLRPVDARAVPRLMPDALRAEDPDAWDPEDTLLALLRRANGDVVGVLSVDEPLDGRRPDDDRIDRLVALSHVIAVAVEQAQAARDGAAHRVALERLLAISARVLDPRSRRMLLEDVCAGIRDALGFQRVAVLLAEDTGILRPAATAGWAAEDPVFAHPALTLDRLQGLVGPAYARHGCFLVGREDAEALLDLPTPVYRSRRNGRGPYAWDRHWLLVPLADDLGEPRGVVWVDDPTDRLLPGRERLQVLRLFAGQASAALEAARVHEAASRRADHDELTGLPNRAVLIARLQHALQRVKRSGLGVAVLFLDLDRFKETNDTFGHAAGDEVLRISAARIDDELRPGDTVARFGGDEFLILCEDVDGPEAAMEVAERLRVRLAEPLPVAAGIAHVTASIGVALPDRPDRGAETIIQAADRAMYEAKASGRDAARLAMPGAGWP